ncbi:hypothetical protein [Bradyrhizobium sp. AUGA SZCCT0182]|uniref:hypothetical protein n=1 Tax=Bradyrhizobium sp. AUGA SZCCT0182 TaxID=2807667 RepID=UPI001BA469B1|nr:hypothetical protein [Bradyrhizobium sp. AUGA SZCCT0182]MBR1231712.1 hypothetical protein [Bradyrhizobium sp. AUGA SZCCT0182]
MLLGPTDPEEIIRFLLEDTPEPYLFARAIGLLTLCAWMRWPDDQDAVLDAQTTAAATAFLHERTKGNMPTIPLTLDRLCDSIVNRRAAGQYWEAFNEQMGITDIVSFFMHCPEEQRPSLGKAYYFIDEGGLVSAASDEEERTPLKRDRSSLKDAWKKHARSGPLLWATLVFEKDSEAFWYAPDDIHCLKKANALVQSKQRLLNLFGIALFSQERLIQLLQTTGAAPSKFPLFPTIVKPIEPDIGTFDKEQLRILDSYSAPQ